MAKVMKVSAWLSLLLTAIFALLYRYTKNGLLFSLAITAGTTAYHFVMRLTVGFVINRLLNNRVNYRASWFRVGVMEQKLYKRLHVKKWKGKMPTYDPSCFDSKIHSWEEIVQAMCQAELVHELIIVLSFVPIVASVPFGSLAVFVITSLLAACFDGVFVVMQRFNRPRVLKLVKN